MNFQFYLYVYVLYVCLIACDCNPGGTIGGTNVCQVANGDCPCKANVDLIADRQCTTCVDGFFNLTFANTDGCEGICYIHSCYITLLCNSCKRLKITCLTILHSIRKLEHTYI